MTLRSIAAVGLAVLVLATGATAAVPTQAQHPNETRKGASERGPGVAGPPVDMPDVVPDRVAAIHRTIREFLSGDLAASLGEALQDLLGADDATGSGSEKRPIANGTPSGANATATRATGPTDATA